ncbi:hypothetical protein L2737_17025 [Shewanella electrodiphila]|uniref:Uncharacterized protein n=1 Tax=Shewanella electrodiphila TaxID=934143 RepID=A0ABT0KTL3_9GAMM|nr:hypothetical protein [Shewanella electrodiphila]MCL1047004.1 hypothetical protein [Shewanella electrodiphila]
MYIAIKVNQDYTVISVYCMEKKNRLCWWLKGTMDGEILSRRKNPSSDEYLRLHAAILALRNSSDTKQFNRKLCLTYDIWAEFVVLAKRYEIEQAMSNKIIPHSNSCTLGI